MKIYEKPMAIIEKIEVEDVITSSATTSTLSTATLNANETAAMKAATGATDVIVFEW